MNRSTKKTTVIILALITVIIGVIAVIIAMQLQSSQRPPDASAGTVCLTDLDCGTGFRCNNNNSTTPGVCVSTTPNVPGGGACTPGGAIECQSGFCCTCAAPIGNKCLDTSVANNCNTYCQQLAGGSSSTPTSQPGGSFQCPNGGTAIRCLVFTCPNGDTNGDGKCEDEDVGAQQVERFTAAECGVRDFGGKCYQVDYYKSGAAGTYNQSDYCGHAIDLNICRPTSTAPNRGICMDIRRTPQEGEGKTDSYAAGTPFSFRVRYDQCSSANQNIRLFVFKNSVTAANLVATLNPTNELGVNENGRCRYDFTWNSQVSGADVYRYRVGRLTAAGQFDITRLDDDAAECRGRVSISVGTTVACGQACGSNGNSCGGNHTCSNNVCVANSCLNNPAGCEADMCTPKTVTTPPTTSIPDTGLFDPESRPLLIGLGLILFGIMFNRLNGLTGLFVNRNRN